MHNQVYTCGSVCNVYGSIMHEDASIMTSKDRDRDEERVTVCVCVHLMALEVGFCPHVLVS